MSAAASLPSPPSGAPGAHNGTLPTTFNSAWEEKAYEHIQDLQAKAKNGYRPDLPVAKLLAVANDALNSAKFSIDIRQPDKAYTEYLRAYEIVATVIPGGGKQLDVDQSQERLYKQLQMRLNQHESQFMKIRDIIKNNNMRSGVLPQGYTASTIAPQPRPQSQQYASLQAPYAPLNGGKKVKPSVSPKPEALHSRAVSQGGQISGNSSGPSALNDRFARLRMQGTKSDAGRPDSRASNSSLSSSPISMPSAVDYSGRDSFDAPMKSDAPNGRPQGPRSMLNGGPVLPAKLPLDTQFAASMPKAPSPTYSPARNMQTTGNIAPPRHSARSLASSDVRKSSASSRAPNGAYQGGEYFPAGAPDGAVLGSAQRSHSTQSPRETRCSAERLFDYLPRFHVLLIDVRPRAEFDQGHIYSQNILCIEPMSIQQGMSADQLLESLVLSPELEQGMFDNRNVYDLVVYYDGSTQSPSYLSRPVTEQEAKLKYLHEALFDYNQEKPLQQPPMLLIGGINAWVDLVGMQALSTSSTLSRVKPSRPIQRRPPATTQGSSIYMPKRRHRDFAPLGQDEERAWRERVRAESLTVPKPSFSEDGEDDDGERDEQAKAAIDSFNERYKDFNQRFPEPESIERHPDFMRSQLPGRAPPPPPAKIPNYPAAPSPSQYQQAPQRPRPAAPRMSYTGVSDRAVSQNTPTGRSDGMVPYIPPKFRTLNMPLPKTGLQNFGVTCYMNSVVQALSATTPMSLLFLNDGFKRNIQHNWKGSKGVMPELFSNLIRSLYKGDVQCIRPTTFKNFCGRLNRDWNGDTQQDAMTFLGFLIETLHQDLNVNWDRTVLKALTPKAEAMREALPKALASKREWPRWQHREFSQVNEVFGGQYMSTCRCLECGTQSTTWEFFTALSVDIHAQRTSTLDECLASFCQTERLFEEERWHCTKCNRKVESTKQITLTRAPQYLVVHFKRFKTDDYGRTSKIHSVVNFPLRGLNLEPYMLPPPSPRDQQIIANIAEPEEKRPDIEMTPPYNYDAYAVLRHLGHDLNGGHYITASKDRARKTWRIYNDDKIYHIDPESNPRDRLQNREAYIVFYERVMPDAGRL